MHYLGNNLSVHSRWRRNNSAYVICRFSLVNCRNNSNYIFLRFSGKQFPKKEDLIHIAIIGIALLGFGNGLVVVGEQYIESGLAALLITTVPFWMVGVESFLPNGPKLNWMVITGLIIGSLGVGLIFGGDLKYIFETKYLIGVLSILGAVVSWSLGSVYSKYKKVSVHPPNECFCADAYCWLASNNTRGCSW